MADTMTNDQIMSEFEELFGSETKPDEEETPAAEEPAENTDKEPEEETASGEEEKPEEESEEKPEEKPEEKSEERKQSKQNYAFAELRTQNKQNEQFIRGLGKLVGLDKDASVEDIKDKIKEVLIAKEAKDNNISIK